MKVVSIIGARPQFIKAVCISRALRAKGHQEFILHTGQHYDRRMSQIFFDDLEIPQPDVNLAIGSGLPGWQVAKMLMGIEQVLLEQRPDCVVIFGDTNSTLAGAIGANKLHMRLAHVEAGLRSFNREMPEEHNRVLSDHCSDLLFCPTKTAVNNLAVEGITEGVYLVGDTMYDAILQFSDKAAQMSTIINDQCLNHGEYLLLTIHRPYNADVPGKLKKIFLALGAIEELVIFPIHPRTKEKLAEISIQDGVVPANVRLIDPVSYLDMLALEQHARVILTDSGGVQKEAYLLGTPCVTLRPETEWLETVDRGWNVLVDTDERKIVHAVNQRVWPTSRGDRAFGDGDAGKKIVEILESSPAL